MTEIEDINEETSYRGNQNLKPRNVKIQWTKQRIQEFIKCKNNPEYFISNYLKIVSLDDGVIPFQLRDYQKDILDIVSKNSHFIGVLSRQSGKCSSGNSSIKIRNKKTGEVRTVLMKEFHNEISI